MAEAKQVTINRDFVISGSLSAQGFRVGVRIDTTATRLIRLALTDFSKARGLEQEIVDALGLFDETMKTVRKDLAKANRRRREGVPSGMKQNYMVRTMISAAAFKSAVMVDQIQRDLTMLSLAGSPQVAEVAAKAQDTVSEALRSLDSVVSYVSKELDTRNQRSRKGKPQASTNDSSTVDPKNSPPVSGQSDSDQLSNENNKKIVTKKSPAKPSPKKKNGAEVPEPSPNPTIESDVTQVAKKGDKPAGKGATKKKSSATTV